MTFNFLAIFFLTVLVATFTPGPSMLLAFNNGVKYGVRRSMATALGTTTAATIQAAISIAGLGAILLKFANIFYMVKILGAFYLIYLGIKIFFSKQFQIAFEDNSLKRDNTPISKLFTEGFVIGISNPKAILFFTAIFTQFINPAGNQITQYIIMPVLNALITFGCMMVYSISGEKFLFIFQKPLIKKLFNKIVGSIFMGLGLKVAFND